VYTYDRCASILDDGDVVDGLSELWSIVIEIVDDDDQSLDAL